MSSKQETWFLGDGNNLLCSKACADRYTNKYYDEDWDGTGFEQCSGFVEEIDRQVGDQCTICGKTLAAIISGLLVEVDPNPWRGSSLSMGLSLPAKKLPRQISVLAEERERLVLERQLRLSIKTVKARKLGKLE